MTARSKAVLPFAVEYVFSRRRTVSLEVRNGQVRVRAPVGTDKTWLARLVVHRAAWVEQKLQLQSEKQVTRPRYRFVDGEVLPWLDSELVLSVAPPASKANTRRLDDVLRVTPSVRSKRSVADGIEHLVSAWYRDAALTLLTAKTHTLCAALGLECRAVSVRATRSKWGHCTADARIQYNWQIVLAPERVVDYLVAHEVCHLRHPDHSPAFWGAVASVCQSWRDDRAWLKQHGYRLQLSSI